jgi:hypothetical protein
MPSTVVPYLKTSIFRINDLTILKQAKDLTEKIRHKKVNTILRLMD